MAYQYAVTFDDFKRAQLLGARRNLRAKLSFYFWQGGAPVLGLVALCALIWDIVFRHFSFSPIVGGILAGSAWMGLYCPIRRPFLLRKLYKQMLNGRPPDSLLQIGIEGGQLIFRVPGRSEGRFYRSAVREFAEDDDFALLFLTKKGFLMIPKKALPREGWLEIETWLAQSEQEALRTC